MHLISHHIVSPDITSALGTLTLRVTTLLALGAMIGNGSPVPAQGNETFEAKIQKALANRHAITMTVDGCFNISTPGVLDARNGDETLDDGTILNLRPSVQTPRFVTRLGSIREKNGKMIATTGSFIDKSESNPQEQSTICPVDE